MFKKILTVIFFFSALLSFSQELVNYTPVELKRNRDVFQIVDNNKKETTLFISDKEKVKAILLNEKMQITDSISTERPDKKVYTDMIGYNTNNSNARLYWSSSNHKQIFSQLYDFRNRKISINQYTLPFKDEVYLQKFSSKDKFYILSVIKESSIFKLHIFDQDGKYDTKSIDLNTLRFYKKDYTKTSLYGVLEENFLPFESPFSIQNIITENPSSIADGAKKRKCYFNEKEIIITLDTNVDYTQILTINLDSYTIREKVIQKPIIVTQNRSNLNSNSFYFDNKLYQIKSSPDSFAFTIKNLEGDLLKEFNVTPDTPIDFKNSDIYQEGSDFGGKRILENSSQFIRKVNNLYSGISCYHIGENTLVTLGSVSELKQSTGQIALGQFGLVGAIAASAIYYNPTMQSFNSYANRKVVKIECLFDKDNNHIKEELKPLAFDKIRTFFDENTDVSSQTLYKLDSNYYLGYYDNKTKEYIIRKFFD
ncbi:hypothetical protein [Flavobacterium sp. HTF]|uniref:hypothetical protein n=1 Tax=Flavobacterium sp. HTF TaxID=2170732 RepID=UPI000D5F63B2|nr:hypothetical protein [Flavobacterium sp. HTF]PWB28435.1 hypothetical protein DCO46_00570 [Flavobacterium sp. HTF]